MAGYTRQSTFQDGDTITAALFNDEYDQLLNVFSNTSGHKHDGTAAEGPVIGLIGDAGLVTPLNKILIDTTNDHIEFWLDVSGTSTQQLYIADGAILPVTDNDIDLGSSSLEFKDLFIDGTANIDSLVADTADINGGTLDNVTIGATTAAAGTFTTVDTSGNVIIGGNLTVSGTTTTVNSNEVNIGDNIIVLNSDETGTPSQDGGIEIERGTSTNVSLLWNETNDYWTFGSNHLNFPDNSKAYFGTGNDLQIYHDGSASYINDQGTGPLYLKGNTVTAVNLSDVAMFTAIGGNKVGLNYNGNEKLATTPTGINVTGTATATAFSGPLTGNVTGDVTGNVTGNLTGSVLTAAQTNITSVGTLSSLAVSGDLTVDTNTLYVDSSNNRVGIGTTSPSQLLHLVGTNPFLKIEESDATNGFGNIIYNSDSLRFRSRANTSNGIIRFEGNNGTTTTEYARFDSSGNLGIGTSSPLALLHVAGNALVTGNLTVNGNLTFGNAATDTVSFGADIDSHIIPDDDDTYDLGSASQEWKDLYIDGVVYADQIDLGDNEKIRLGTSQDLQIYHDGSNSFIQDAGTGTLRILSDDVRIMNAAGTEISAQFIQDGEARLKYDNSTKLATKSTGIDVTGTVVADGLTSSGSVAITTTSGLPLTVSGHDTWNYPLRITNTTASTNLDLKQGTGGASILTTGTALTFQTASTERARFTATGLGIGTTSPDYSLDVRAASNVLFKLASTSASNNARMVFAPNNAIKWNMGVNIADNAFTWFDQDTSTSPVRFEVGAANNTLVVDSNSRVGIGTNSPGEKLHISSASPVIRLEDTTDPQTSGGSVGKIEFYGNDGSSGGAGVRSYLQTVSTNAAGNDHALAIGLSGSNAAPTEKIRLTNTGLGIGTTSPSRQLVIYNTSNSELELYSGTTASGFIYFRDSGDSNIGALQYNHNGNYMAFRVNDAERIRIDSSGNVGIGTTSPADGLELSHVNPKIRIRESDVTNGFADILYNSTRLRIRSRNDAANGGIAFEGQAGSTITEYARFNNVGNLGIGTSSPSQELHIVSSGESDIRLQGSGSSNYLDIFHNSTEFGLWGTGTNIFKVGTNGAERIRIDSSGRLGLNTSDPDGQGYSYAEDLVILGGNSADDGVGITLRGNGKRYGVLAFGDNADPNSGEIFYDHTANSMSFRTNDQIAATIDSSGNLTVGTGISYNASADDTLIIGATNRTSVNNGTYFNYQLKVSGAATGQDLTLQAARNIDGSSDDVESIFQYDASSDAQIFFTNATERMRIDSSGNVGIGISSVQTQGALTGNLLEIHEPSFGSGVGGTLVLSSDNTANGRHGGRIIGRARSYVHSSIDFQADSGMANGGLLKFSTLTAGSATTDNPTERMRIDSSGRLLVGKTAVDNTTVGFRFDGASGFASFVRDGGEPLYLNRKTSDGDVVKIAKDGTVVGVIGTQNWGIGTSSPVSKLHIVDALGGGQLLVATSEADNAEKYGTFGTQHYDVDQEPVLAIAAQSSSSENNVLIGGALGEFNAATSIKFFTAANATTTTGSERMRIDASGNVGIGTTNPTRALDVNGGIAISGSQVINASGTNDTSIEIGANTASNHYAFIDLVGDTTYSDYGLRIIRNNGGANTSSFIYHRGTGNFNIETQDSASLKLRTAGTDALTILPSGNVGIGTSSPSDNLHVSGSARFNNVVPSYTDANGTSSSTNYFKLGTITLHSSQGAVITVMGTTSYSAGSNISGETKIYLRGNNSVSTLTGHFFGTTLGNATVQAVRWKNTGSNNVFEIWIKYGSSFAGLEHYVDTDGTWTSNVSDTGSTSAPSGSTALTSVFAVTTAGTQRMRIDSSGNLGIGTTNPSHKLDIVGGGLEITQEETTDAIALLDSSNSNTKYFSIQGDNGDCNINAPAGELVLQRAGTQRLTVGTSGVTINGALSKSSGSFKIDHPLKPNTHHLVHSFVEGPQADNLYRGVIKLNNGKATIDLDDWFGMTAGTFLALNRDIQAFVNNSETWDAVRANVQGSQLVIECQNSESNAEVAWLVIGERQDKEIHDSILTDDNGKIIIEPEKA